ncbi:M1-specific T cell receptor beta chain-like [Acipenser oxyrinchus oxyrinchus]|nr:M1-specific T cell receptor beta chain-like [Acipenser oxyrinchus oxyrinchus]
MKKIYNLNLNYYIAGACSIVTQSPPFLRAEVGSAVNLSCSIEQVNGFCFHVTWYKIVPSRPGSLVPLADHTARRNGTQAGPRDKQCNLTLGRVETQDSAIYYCAYSKNVMIYTGDGSKLLVTERSPAPTSMVLLSQSDSDSSASAALVCLLYGPVSAQTRLYWNISGRVDPGLSDSGSLNSSESDGSQSFFLRNQISVAADVWSHGAPCTCVAETEAGVRISRTFQKRNTDKAGNCVWFYAVLLVASLLLVGATILTILLCKRASDTGKNGEENCPAVKRSEGPNTGRAVHVESRRNVQTSVSVVGEVHYASVQFDKHRRKK